MQDGKDNDDCKRDISALINLNSPENVFSEVKAIVSSICPDFEFTVLEKAYNDVVRLFNGEYPGFRKCNTEYHDLKHTTDVLIAMARLIHGFHIEGNAFSREILNLGLISAVMHDTGYIQTEDDVEGTGAKYTLVHVERSVEFMKKYFEKNNLSSSDAGKCSRIITATNLSVKLKDIPFESEEEKLMGKALFASDMLGQMADRVYLENLLFLFKEFAEGLVRGYQNEDELLKKTIGFYEIIKDRLEREIGYKDSYMKSHFLKQWAIDCDLYLAGIEKNISYLKKVIEGSSENYAEMLRRGGIVKKYKEQASCALEI